MVLARCRYQRPLARLRVHVSCSAPKPTNLRVLGGPPCFPSSNLHPQRFTLNPDGQPLLLVDLSAVDGVSAVVFLGVVLLNDVMNMANGNGSNRQHVESEKRWGADGSDESTQYAAGVVQNDRSFRKCTRYCQGGSEPAHF